MVEQRTEAGADLGNLYIVLIHYPVQNRKGEQVGSAVTNLDLHDLARAGRTFGVRAVYVVTPYEDQVALVNNLISHWTQGAGSKVNPDRKEALNLLKVKKSWEESLEDICRETGYASPVKIVTSARVCENTVSIQDLQASLGRNIPHVLAFGTAWGLSKEFMDACDMTLAPIRGAGKYNHLPVRSAVSIYLDRLNGCR